MTATVVRMLEEVCMLCRDPRGAERLKFAARSHLFSLNFKWKIGYSARTNPLPPLL